MQQPQASTPISAQPKSRLALLEKLKNKVSQIDNVIKEVPISQPIPVAPAAVVQASPAPTQKITKSTPPSSNKKASKQKKSRPSKDADEYDPMSEEEQAESDNRPRRQRKPNRYTDGEDGGEVGSDPLRRALSILRACKAHKWSWPFTLPVDPIALNIPDYFNIVKRPMDLGTIEQKLLNNEYADIWGFGEDVELVWRNCFLYNQPLSDVVKMGEAMKKYFDDKFKKLSEDVLNPQPIDSVQNEYIPTEPRSSPSLVSQPPKPKAPPKKRTKKTVPVDSREMSFEEKKVLSENIEKLDPDQMVKIVQIIQLRAPRASSQANEQEIEIDLDKLDAVTLRQLEKFVYTCLNKKKPKKKKPSASKQATPAATVPAPVQQPSTASPTPVTTTAVAAPAIAAAVPAPIAAPAKDESESSDTEESSDDSSEESSSDDDDEKKPASLKNDSSGPQSLAQGKWLCVIFF